MKDEALFTYKIIYSMIDIDEYSFSFDIFVGLFLTAFYSYFIKYIIEIYFIRLIFCYVVLYI